MCAACPHSLGALAETLWREAAPLGLGEPVGPFRSCPGLAPWALAKHKQSTGLFVSGLAPPPLLRSRGHPTHPARHRVGARRWGASHGVAKVGWGWLWRAWEAPRSTGPAAPARSAVQPLTRRRCLSAVSAANVASSAAGPRDRCTEPGHKQSSGLFVPGEGPGHWPGPQGSLSAAKAAEDKRHGQPQPAFAAVQAGMTSNAGRGPDVSLWNHP